MGILGWIIFGLIAGIIAKMLRPGTDPSGWIITIIIGIAGALLGGWIGTMLGWGGIEGFFNIKSWLLAIVGAIILLWLYSKMRRA